MKLPELTADNWLAVEIVAEDFADATEETLAKFLRMRTDKTDKCLQGQIRYLKHKLGAYRQLQKIARTKFNGNVSRQNLGRHKGQRT